jgi:hypothetical protein
MDWLKTSHWKVYSIRSRQAAGFPTDTLSNFPSARLKYDSMQTFLAHVMPVDTKSGVMWQGYIVGTCELENVTRKIIFSVYGGFFFDPETKQYYEIENDLQLRKEWHKYIMDVLKRADPNATIL